MADDLIPPPSPAGRPGVDPPEPDAPRMPPGPADDRGGGGLWAGDSAAGSVAGRGAPVNAAHAEPEPQAAAEPPPPAPYRPRFGFVAGALVGVAIAAVALAAVLVAGVGRGGPAAGWSDWEPSTQEGVRAAREIAHHVAPKYRQDGKQLVLVEAGPLEVSNPPVPLAGVALTPPQGGNIELLEGNAVMFTLNGLGNRGSIASGRPTKERHLLLRREALELALYTFRFAREVDLVVALLPPSAAAAAAAAAAVAAASTPATSAQQLALTRPQALLFRPNDLRRELDMPLRETIPLQTPRPDAIPGAEARTIDRLTLPQLFMADFKQAQNLRAYLVLDPIS